MLFVTDLLVDNADDIVLSGDIEDEPNYGINLVRCAERRVSARYDDFLLDDISAGIERFILQKEVSSTISDIETAIRTCLSKNALFYSNEYDVYILEATKDGKLPIILKFRAQNFPAEYADRLTFRVTINIENQRSYK